MAVPGGKAEKGDRHLVTTPKPEMVVEEVMAAWVLTLQVLRRVPPLL
jgi:hypothetical protein